jgi:hypothetical protein
MENPRAVNRICLAMLVVYGAAAIAASIYFRDLSILIYSVAAIPLVFAMFGAVAVLNTIMFAPVFWLMAKVSAQKAKRGR